MKPMPRPRPIPARCLCQRPDLRQWRQRPSHRACPQRQR